MTDNLIKKELIRKLHKVRMDHTDFNDGYNTLCQDDIAVIYGIFEQALHKVKDEAKREAVEKRIENRKVNLEEDCPFGHDHTSKCRKEGCPCQDSHAKCDKCDNCAIYSINDLVADEEEFVCERHMPIMG